MAYRKISQLSGSRKGEIMQNNLLVEYGDETSVILNGERKPQDEALDIMTSLGIDSTKAYYMLRDARKGKPVVIDV